METKKMNFEISGAGVLMNTNRDVVRLTSRNGKPKRPSEIPQPDKDPETVPSEEPATWPKKEPKITPGKEPLTTPPGPQPKIPSPPQSLITSNIAEGNVLIRSSSQRLHYWNHLLE